jgi:hypothetical protein
VTKLDGGPAATGPVVVVGWGVLVGVGAGVVAGGLTGARLVTGGFGWSTVGVVRCRSRRSADTAGTSGGGPWRAIATSRRRVRRVRL